MGVSLTKEQKELVGRTNMTEAELVVLKRAFMEVKGINAHESQQKKKTSSYLSLRGLSSGRSAAATTGEPAHDPALEELNLEEFTKVFGTFISKSEDTTNVDFEDLFRTIDADHNGKVSFTELILWLSVYAKGTEEEKLKNLFSLIDEDGNGTVEGDELQNLLVILTASCEEKLTDQAATQKARDIIKVLDKDRDGRVAIDEWVRVGKSIGLVQELLGPQFTEVMSHFKIV
eukprot:TRINITY_DN5647_c0_g1_i1.p2 TRINITY_DN5647_c0_g1~~TRINITY_DN5647_c0_g1_i1.p2  ORF type:complete len:231 (+),score=70.10 TRINITY_DN5647_c0_g1_i1:1453-2145(+)